MRSVPAAECVVVITPPGTSEALMLSTIDVRAPHRGTFPLHQIGSKLGTASPK